MTPSSALIASLHPSGDPARIVRISEPAKSDSGVEMGDVVVLVSSATQCRDARQRDALIRAAVSALAPGGVMWVEVPRRWRSSTRARLRAHGLVCGRPSIRRERGAQTAEFAITSRAVRFALRSGHISRSWRAVLTLLERVPGGTAILFRLLPGVGFAAYRQGTRPFAWLVDRFVEPENVDIALATNWRGQHAPFVVFGLGRREAVVAKRGGRECRAQLGHETAMLKLLGPDLATCGLDVPRLIDCHDSSKLYSLIESDVPGRPMASLMRDGHHRDLGAVMDRLARWLACWNRATLRHIELTAELGERLIVSRARDLAESIEHGSAYMEWLARETGRLVGTSVPLVAAHNDLTMANVLGDASGICSVVDWEAARRDGLPLTDFRYGACHAAQVISGRGRLAAFRECYVDGGDLRQRLLRAEAPLRAVIGGPPAWLELCIHAGWLSHAANERARPVPDSDGAFIAIAQLLANSALRTGPRTASS